MEGTDVDESLQVEAPVISDRVDLQGSDVSRSFFLSNCVRCPANGGIVHDVDTERTRLYCDLRTALLSGNVSEAASLSHEVEDVLGEEPGCGPYSGGKNMREFSRLLEETEAI